ncbi:transposase [Patescibacteria group bacterium]|nr:transposase [Patescibacteria group bacterium]
MADSHKTRKSIRVKGYDYSKPGYYFITICAQNRNCLFGDVRDRQMVLNDAGRMIETVWNELPEHYQHVELDAFIIMPNHVHGIIVLRPDPIIVGAGLKPARTKPAPTKSARTKKRHALPEIVRGLKTFSSRRINEIRNTLGVKLWQRNYYEHIVRNENELNKIRKYIQENPLKWETDKENPKHINML